VFYGTLPFIPYRQTELQRYFSAHWIQKIETGLFFVAISALISNWRRVKHGFFNSSQPTVLSPLMLAEQKVAEQLLARSESMINCQMEIWQNSLESLRNRWANTLAKQQGSLDQALQAGMALSLTNHSQQLEQSRSEYLLAFQSASESIRQQLSETRAE